MITWLGDFTLETQLAVWKYLYIFEVLFYQRRQPLFLKTYLLFPKLLQCNFILFGYGRIEVIAILQNGNCVTVYVVLCLVYIWWYFEEWIFLYHTPLNDAGPSLTSPYIADQAKSFPLETLYKLPYLLIQHKTTLAIILQILWCKRVRVMSLLMAISQLN